MPVCFPIGERKEMDPDKSVSGEELGKVWVGGGPKLVYIIKKKDVFTIKKRKSFHRFLMNTAPQKVKENLWNNRKTPSIII